MQTSLYLLFEIEYQTDVLRTALNLYDRRWKEGQIDLLKQIQTYVDSESET